MKDFKIYIFVASALLLVYLVAQYNKPAAVNWKPTLYYQDKIPYGTFILFNQLHQLYPGSEVFKTNASVYHEIKDSVITGGSYLIIAGTINLTKVDFNQLAGYIKAGNSVFMSSFAFRGFLADTLKINTSYETSKGAASLNFTNKNLKRTTNYSFKRDVSNQYFDSFDTTKAVVVGQNNHGHATFISYKFGKGYLYLCANPLLFSNFSLLSDDGADFAAKALSYVPATDAIYWDEFQNGDIPEDISPMRVFFSKPSLQWAYYLSLSALVIFVLFQVKRRQRVIPVAEPLKNATLDFVNVVGQVYYEQRDNTNIAHKKILYLLTYLRDKYNLKVNKMDAEFIDSVATKLSIDSGQVKELVDYINFIGNQQRVTDKELVELNQIIEKFYDQIR
ncbi:MAG TPA: DUF4350 domain-containing protein [Mucilaginibacter sp.]|nr:DUF4350 domain-containing protein [Mucilaginibacter sp.]